MKNILTIFLLAGLFPFVPRFASAQADVSQTEPENVEIQIMKAQPQKITTKVKPKQMLSDEIDKPEERQCVYVKGESRKITNANKPAKKFTELSPEDKLAQFEEWRKEAILNGGHTEKYDKAIKELKREMNK